MLGKGMLRQPHRGLPAPPPAPPLGVSVTPRGPLPAARALGVRARTAVSSELSLADDKGFG